MSLYTCLSDRWACDKGTEDPSDLPVWEGKGLHVSIGRQFTPQFQVSGGFMFDTDELVVVSQIVEVVVMRGVDHPSWNASISQ